jgi:hypothetical protein
MSGGVKGPGDAVAFTVPSVSIYNATAWVADKDKYQLVAAPHSIEEFGNPLTEIQQVLRSGFRQGINKSFDEPTGKNTWVFIIKARYQAENSFTTYLDDYRGVDTNANTTVHDEPTEWSNLVVTVQGVIPGGPGGPSGGLR